MDEILFPYLCQPWKIEYFDLIELIYSFSSFILSIQEASDLIFWLKKFVQILKLKAADDNQEKPILEVQESIIRMISSIFFEHSEFLSCEELIIQIIDIVKEILASTSLTVTDQVIGLMDSILTH